MIYGLQLKRLRQPLKNLEKSCFARYIKNDNFIANQKWEKLLQMSDLIFSDFVAQHE